MILLTILGVYPDYVLTILTTFLHFSPSQNKIEYHLNSDLTKINKGSKMMLVNFNPQKTESVLF